MTRMTKEPQRVPLTARIRTFIRNIPSIPTRLAIGHLTRAMHKDVSYRHSWYANIAMAAYDEGVEIGAAQRAAKRFMRNLFGLPADAKYLD